MVSKSEQAHACYWRKKTTFMRKDLRTTIEVKVKVPLTDPKAQRRDRGIALLFLDLGTRSGWVVSTPPRPLFPRERPGPHSTGGFVGPRDGLDVCETSRPPRASSPGPSSPVASRYTDWAIPAPLYLKASINFYPYFSYLLTYLGKIRPNVITEWLWVPWKSVQSKSYFT
jgi:hypothetical protein